MAKQFKKLEQRLRLIEEAADGFENLEGQSGWFPDAAYDDGTPVAYVMNIQEYGAPAVGIPPRPYFSTAIHAHEREWSKQLAAGVLAVARGKRTAEQVLTGVSQLAAGHVRAQIAATSSPPLSPTTLMLRKWRREGREITGSTVGAAAAAVAAGEDYSGVPSDPLRDTGYAISTLTGITVRSK